MNRTVATKARASAGKPTDWRSDTEEGRTRLDRIVRAVRRPRPPTADELAELSTSLNEILREPTVDAFEDDPRWPKHKRER